MTLPSRSGSPRRDRKFRAAIALGGAALVLASAPAPASAAGRADSGFRPTVDGFSFANYTRGRPGLDMHELVRLFGHGSVCQTATGRCRLTPVAGAWMRTENRLMAGGHCYGMSVTALRLFTRALLPTAFGGPDTFDLIPSSQLEREIAEGWALQGLPAFSRTRFSRSPQQVVATLRRALATGSEHYTLILFRDGYVDGHAITPYAVRVDRAGDAAIEVYDNNHPRQTRTVHVSADGAWSYGTVSGPYARGDGYSGDASSRRLGLDPLSPASGRQTCPFCAGSGHARGGAAVTVTDIAERGPEDDQEFVTVSGPGGHEAGLTADGDLVDQIPGSAVAPPLTDGPGPRDDTPVAPVLLPPGRSYTLTATGRGSAGTRLVRAIGPGWLAGAGGLPGGAGPADRLQVSADGHEVRVRVGDRATPRLVLADADVRVVVRVSRVAAGTELTARLSDGRASFTGPANATITVSDAAGDALAHGRVAGHGSVRFPITT